MEDIDIPGVYLTLDGDKDSRRVAMELQSASQRLRRSAGKAKNDGLADPTKEGEPKGLGWGGVESSDDGNVVSLEVLVEAIVLRYGAAPQPEWVHPTHMACSFILIPLVMSVTRLMTDLRPRYVRSGPRDDRSGRLEAEGSQIWAKARMARRAQKN